MASSSAPWTMLWKFFFFFFFSQCEFSGALSVQHLTDFLHLNTYHLVFQDWCTMKPLTALICETLPTSNTMASLKSGCSSVVFYVLQSQWKSFHTWTESECAFTAVVCFVFLHWSDQTNLMWTSDWIFAPDSHASVNRS